jgi:hypothetical protein
MPISFLGGEAAETLLLDAGLCPRFQRGTKSANFSEVSSLATFSRPLCGRKH